MNLAFNLQKIHLKPRGKNSRLAYHWRFLCHRLAPNWWLSRRAKALLNSLETHPDHEYILKRVNYYCQFTEESKIEGQYQLDSKLRLSFKNVK